MSAQNNHDNLVNEFSVETRKEFEQIRALDLPEKEKEQLLQSYWNVRRWSHPNAFEATR